MFSLGRLASGLASPGEPAGHEDETDSWGNVSEATTEGTTGPSRARSPASHPSSAPCFAATTQASLGYLPSNPSTATRKALPLQLITTALSVGPTLLPPHLANLITALALSMRVSLRATAFFVEAILESCKYGTAAGLGLTRRALIAAVSSARTIYAVREGMDWAGDKLESLGRNDAFLTVLDKYTNLGIYLITHTFTLAELFAMSGFYLTSTAVQTGISAAQESVSLFDGIFGSNESSRALSSIITLIRTEVMHDKRLIERKMGTVRSLTALTRALTAYACLQLATRKRFSKATQDKVLFDCTVVGQLNEDLCGRIDVNLEQGSKQSSDNSPALDQHGGDPWNPPSGFTSPTHLREEPTYLLTDVRSLLEQQQQQQQQHEQLRSSTSSSPASVADEFAGAVESSDDDVLVRQLEHLVGEDPEESGDEGARRRRWVERGEQDAFYEITEQVTEHVTETQTIEHYKAEDFHRLRQTGSSRPTTYLSTTTANDDEWIEVENGLSPEPAVRHSSSHPDDHSSCSSHVRLVALGSSPNGAAAPITTVASRAYNEALDNPQESSARVQVILKTITRRLLQKKRTVKRVRGHSSGSPPPVPRNTLRSESSERASSLMDIDWSNEGKEDSQADLKEVEDLIDSPTSQSDVTLTPSTITGPAGEQLFPPPVASMLLNSPSPSPSPSLSTSRPLSSAPAITPRKGRRQNSGYTSTSSPSTPSSLGSLSRALIRAKGKLQTRVPKTDVASVQRSPKSAAGTLSASNGEPTDHAASSPTGPKLNLRPRPTSLAPLTPENRQRSPPTLSSADDPSQDRRHRHESVTSTHTQELRSQYHSSAQAPPSDDASPAALFPDDHLIRNIHKFCRFSSAAYGQNFLRVLGLGSTDFMFPSGGRYHPNTWAFAQHTNLPIECMLLSSYVDPGPTLSHEKLSPLVHYIAVDHAAKAIVLTCRGTLGLSDVLVDLCCEYEQVEIEGGDPQARYLAHSGMLFSARKLMSNSSTIHETIRKALEDHPTYGLVLTGHSLGGGAAALLSILWSCPTSYYDQHVASLPGASGTVGQRTPFVTNFSSGLPPGRPIHCYTYGCPSVASVDLALHSKGLISSVVQNNDIVPTLSLGILRDFKNIAVTLSDEGSVTEEIVGRVVGLHQRRLRIQYGPALLRPNGVAASFVEPPQPARPDKVRLSPEEFEHGRSRNYAEDQHYRDPADESPFKRGVPTEEQMLDDWLFSLYTTLRADMDSEKLYPPGKVYNMEHWQVYLTGTPTTSPNPNSPSKTSQRGEAHRVVLRLVSDVPRRFGELNFTKSMLNDHLPTNYEKSTALLYQGLFGS